MTDLTSARSRSSASGRRLVFVTESPTPYYTPILNALATRVQLHVIYLDRGRAPGRGGPLWSDFDDPWGERPDFDHSFISSLPLRLGKADFHTQLSVGASRVIRRLAPHVVVVHSWGPQMIEPLLWARFGRHPSVMWLESTRDSGLVRGRLSTAIRRWVVGLADSYVSNGRSATEFATEMGASASLISTACLPSAVAERLAAGPLEAMNDRRSTAFLFVGRLVGLKRPIELAEAFAEASLAVPELATATLTMVGDGPLREALEVVAAQTSGRIILRGRLEGDRLADAYRGADVLVVPSTREVWGLVVNEALAAGLFVVAGNRVGSAADLLDRGSGSIVDPDIPGALSHALVAASQADQSQAARQNRRDRVAGCRADTFAGQIEAAASRAIDAKRRTPGRPPSSTASSHAGSADGDLPDVQG